MENKDDEVREQAEDIMQRERANTGRLDITARNIAKDVIKANPNDYSNDLLQLIPKEILDTELTDDNLHEMGLKIDEIRFKKEDELALFLGLGDTAKNTKTRDFLTDIMNRKLDRLPDRQRKIVRKIKFLSNVAQTIIHQ